MASYLFASQRHRTVALAHDDASALSLPSEGFALAITDCRLTPPAVGNAATRTSTASRRSWKTSSLAVPVDGYACELVLDSGGSEGGFDLFFRRMPYRKGTELVERGERWVEVSIAIDGYHCRPTRFHSIRQDPEIRIRKL